MAYFQCVQNRKVILEFKEWIDIETTRKNPDYVEVTKGGVPIGKPRSEQRAPHEIPFRAIYQKGK